jgi:dTDP-4-amino-4,6-dideoxygalactose transaminase
MELIPFNKPYFSGNETVYIKDAVSRGKISGDGPYTKRCSEFFEKEMGFNKTLLTTSCTDALEMAAILLDIKEGDEIIAPSYTFVSTVNAFVLRGAKIVFADSGAESPNIDVEGIEPLITNRTKAIVPVHYAGIACEMDRICALAKEYSLFVVEDAAQAIDSYYRGKPLGTIGDLGAFSFHETKNIISGEGGMLSINNEKFVNRAEIIREKGTNRSAYFRGEIDKYGWVDVGSSFLPSDIISAYLFAQLENLARIQNRRKEIWNLYHESLCGLRQAGIILPEIPPFATNNAHMFYLVCRSAAERQGLISHLKSENILSVFHYLSLHKSVFYGEKYFGQPLVNADRYSDCLVRLPLFYELSNEQVSRISECVTRFFDR